MIWQNPLAGVALLALAAPIVIHLLAERRAERLAFPTLRFIQPARLASVRRRFVEDKALLAIRMALLAAAVAAIAGPFAVTAARRRAWDARTATATVVAPPAAGAAVPGTIVAGDLGAGLRRAAAWLDSQPPSRRRIVVRARLQTGALTGSDIAAIPPHVGLSFERIGDARAMRAVPGTTVLASDASGVRTITRETTLDGAWTRVRDLEQTAASSVPLEIVAGDGNRAAAAAVLDRVLANRVRAPVPGRGAVIVLRSKTDSGPNEPQLSAWEADAAAYIVRELWSVGVHLDLQFGDRAGRLGVVAPIGGDDERLEALVRTVAEALAPSITAPAQEILPIPDAQLRSWTRDPGPAVVPDPRTLEQDDRRWLWLGALLLIGVEGWLRSRRANAASRSAENLVDGAGSSRVA